MARMAVGGFQHETNTYAPQRATWTDFEGADAWPGFIRGAELIDAVHGYNIPMPARSRHCARAATTSYRCRPGRNFQKATFCAAS